MPSSQYFPDNLPRHMAVRSYGSWFSHRCYEQVREEDMYAVEPLPVDFIRLAKIARLVGLDEELQVQADSYLYFCLCDHCGACVYVITNGQPPRYKPIDELHLDDDAILRGRFHA
jgi:hypothetical protein